MPHQIMDYSFVISRVLRVNERLLCKLSYEQRREVGITFCDVCKLDALRECPCVISFKSQDTPGCNQYYAGHILPLDCQRVLLHTAIDGILISTQLDNDTHSAVSEYSVILFM